jgi:phage terminase large subunit GpA-like protein
LVAEHLVSVRTRRGFTKLEWQKLRERNEALDCRVYARAVAWILGADRWSDAKWRDLEMQVRGPEVSVPETSNDPPAAGVIRRPVRRGRRVFKSSYVT